MHKLHKKNEKERTTSVESTEFRDKSLEKNNLITNKIKLFSKNSDPNMIVKQEVIPDSQVNFIILQLVYKSF